MKKTIIILMVVALNATFFSCKPVYQCGETPRKIVGSTRLKKLAKERDQLCKKVKMLEEDKTNLTTEVNKQKSSLADLQKKYDDLEKNYQKLFNEKITQSDQYDKLLKQKNEELNQKERLLAEREQKVRELQRIIDRQDSVAKRLNEILVNALLSFDSDELTVEIRNGKVYVSMSDKLLFKSGSATVEPRGKEALKVLADVLNKNPEIDILVEGHTDNVPIKTAMYKDNWDLSVARATSIVRILTDEYKIPPTRLIASGRGEFYPRASNDTPEGRAKNRRTEIILSPRLDELMKIINRK